jgi:hypothetical protein
MPFKLDFPDICAVKELEIAHENLISNRRNRTGSDNSELANYLQETISVLNFRVRCMCHNMNCEFWDGGRCVCSGNVYCLELGYEIRGRGSGYGAEPSESEIELVKSQLTETELNRMPNEPFISWKVRVANAVYQRAYQLSNQAEEGLTEYRYDSWRSEDTESKVNRFKRTVRDVRTMGLSGAVGCFTCGRIFLTEVTLLAHIDKRRYNHDAFHYPSFIVTPTEIKDVRPTPNDYRPPTPTPTPTSSPSNPNHNSPITEFGRRGSNQSEATYLQNFRRYVRSSFDGNAVGCSRCGRIYANEATFLQHAREEHLILSTSTAVGLEVF